MKLLKFPEKNLNIVIKKEDVLQRLMNLHKSAKANRLFNFYCSIQLDGILKIKKMYAKSTFYRNIKELRDAKIVFSQNYKLEENSIYYFNPFEAEEVK